METKPLCSEPTHDDEEDPDILVPGNVCVCVCART